MLSDERVKKLHAFDTTDQMVSYLYFEDREAARALDAHLKGKA